MNKEFKETLARPMGKHCFHCDANLRAEAPQLG